MLLLFVSVMAAPLVLLMLCVALMTKAVPAPPAPSAVALLMLSVAPEVASVVLPE